MSKKASETRGTAKCATMRILSQEERRQAMLLPAEKPRGLLSRLFLRPPEPTAEENAARYAALTARRELLPAEVEKDLCRDEYGREPFDLADVAQFLWPSAILDEAGTHHRLFPKEPTAWMPPEALTRFLAVDPKTTEGRILIQRLSQARSVFLTIELEPSRDGCEWLQGTARLTLFFCTDNLLELYS